MSLLDPFSDAQTMASAVANDDIKAVDLIELTLSRIGNYNTDLNAFVEVFSQSAIQSALRLDVLQQEGVPPEPLQGVPIALKDLVGIAGRGCSNGMSVRGEIATKDSEIVIRLKLAGMILVGATHMVECAFGGAGTNSATLSPQNPWDRTAHRIAGGSSSGSAVAVAAGLVPVAIGSDTGGSVRIPASLCGVVGFKPSFGTISNEGIVPLSPTLDTIGILTRSVSDASATFKILSGLDENIANRLKARELRIGIPTSEELEKIAPDISARIYQSMEIIESSGATLVPFNFDDAFEDMVDGVGVIIAAEAFHSNRNVIENVRDPAVRKRLEAGRLITADTYLSALQTMRTARVKATRAMDGLDAYITPTTPITALQVENVDHGDMVLSRFTRAVNYLGFCAISIPVGLSSHGLPIGLQLIARSGADTELLSIAEWCEAILPQPDCELLRRNFP